MQQTGGRGADGSTGHGQGDHPAADVGVVGLIGLGRMGRAMAQRLRDRGVDLVVWNRTASVAVDLARTAGARVADSPRALADAADVVLTAVADAVALHEVCTGEEGLLAGLRSGALLIDTGTTGPELVERLAPRVDHLGAHLLECPVAGTPARAERGDLVLLVGGDAVALGRALPLLCLLGHPVHVGSLGAGTALKLSLNAVLFSLNQVTSEALLLAEAGGVDPRTFLTALRASPMGAGIHGFLEAQYLDPQTSVGAGTLATVDKDLALAEAAWQRAGLSLPQIQQLRQTVSALVADGHAAVELGTMPDLLRRAGSQRSEAHHTDMHDATAKGSTA